MIYQTIYNKLDRLVNELPRFLKGKGYLKKKSPGFMDLVIEKIGPNKISLAHYYESHGDLVPDPDMEIKIYPEQRMAEALTYQNTHSYNEVYPKPGKVNIRVKNELNRFLLFWLNNLKKQGFY